MNEEINPLTGLPTGQKINPLTGKTVKGPTVSPRTVATGTFNMPGNQEEFTKYNVAISPYSNMQEERAQNQPWYEQTINGITKNSTIFLGAYVGGPTGYVAGLFDWGLSGFKDYDASMTDNPIVNAVHNINQYVREALPNYYTEAEQYNINLRDIERAGLEGETPVRTAEQAAEAEKYQDSSIKNPISPNFIFDKLLGGAAYSLASIAQMATFRGRGPIGTAVKATGIGPKISRQAARGAAYVASRSVSGKGQYSAIKGALNRVNQFGTALETLEATAAMSIAESSVEALEAGDAVTNDAIERFKKTKAAEINSKNLKNPTFVPVNWEDVELSAQEIQAATLAGEQTKGALFWANMAVLMPTNFITFGKQAAGMRAGGVRNKLVKNKAGEYVDWVETLPANLQGIFKAGRYAQPYVTGALSEGYQEGMQAALQESVSDFELRKLKDFGAADFAAGALESGYFKSLRELGEAGPEIGSSIKDTFSFKSGEANEQMLIGAIIGLLSQGKAGYNSVVQKNKNTEAVTKILNSPEFYNLAVKAETANAGAAIVEQMMQAAERGDEATYKRLQAELISDSVLEHMELDALDIYKKRWEELKALSDDEVKIALGLDENFQFTESFTKEDMIDRVLNHAKKVEEGAKLVEQIFPDTQPLFGDKILGKARSEKEAAKLKYQRIYKKAIIRNYALMNTMDADIDSVIKSFEAIFPNNELPNNLRERLNSYKRKTFGNVNILNVEVDGKTKSVETVEQNVEEEYKALKQELIDVLNKAYQDGLISELEAANIQTNSNLLDELIKTRNDSALALDNLYRKPEERDLYVSKLDADIKAEKNRAVDSIYDEALKSTFTSSQLKDALKDKEFSPRKEREVADEFNKRTEKEAALKYKFDRMSRSDVEAFQTEEGLATEYKKEYLNKREQEQPIVSTVRPTPDPDPKPEPEPGPDPDPDFNVPPPPDDDDVPYDDDVPDDVDLPVDPDLPSEDEDDIPKPDFPDEANLPVATENSNNLVVVRNGATMYLHTEGNPSEIIVDENGVPIKDTDYLDQNILGETVEEFPQLLADPELGPGTQVKIVLFDNLWYQDWQVRNPNATDVEKATVQPMYVMYKGKIVGKLNSGYTALRREAYLKKEATATVTARNANQRSSSINTQGEKQFKPFLDVHGIDSPIGIVKFAPLSNASEPIIEVSLHANENEALYHEAVKKYNQEYPGVLQLGQVVTFMTNPNGEVVMHPLSTRNLNSTEVNKVLELLTQDASESQIKDIEYIIASTKADDVTGAKKWSVSEERNADGSIQITFEALDGVYISVNSYLIKKLLNNSLTAQELETFKNSKFKFTFQRREFDVDGKPMLVIVDPLELEITAEEFTSTLIDVLKEFLISKKTNVALEKLNSPNSAEYLTDIKDRLFTSTTIIEGTPYINIGLDLSLAGSQSEDNTPKEPDVEVEDMTFEQKKADLAALKDQSKTNPEQSGAVGDVGDLPIFRLSDRTSYTTLSKSDAENWLRARGIPVEFYEQAKIVGDSVAHGYMKKYGVYLWNHAEIGTEYHEAFHYVFRTMLNDKQRTGLYKEARKRYAQSLKNKNIDPTKATDLQLEEEMAEDFRNYVLSKEQTADSVPQKIKKFFKDLFAYLKAIVINPVGTDQLFSLIESNRFPKKFERNSNILDADTAYHLVKRSTAAKDYNVHKAVANTLSTELLDEINLLELELLTDKVRTEEEIEQAKEYKRKKTLQLLGNNTDKGKIAESFLYRSVSYKSNKQGLSKADFKEFKTAVDSNDVEQIKNLVQSKDIQFIPPMTADVNPSVYYSMGVASKFYSIYTLWNDEVDDLGNVIDSGWKSVALLELSKHGIRLRTTDVDPESEVEIEDTQYDKIYNQSHFEVSPAKKISDELRRLFGKIESANYNELGIRTYEDIQEVFSAMVAASVGKSNFQEIVKSIKEKSNTLPRLKSIAEYMETEMSAEDAAKIVHIFNLDYAQFQSTKLEVIDEVNPITGQVTNSETIVIDYKTDSNSNAQYISQMWRNSAIQSEVARDNAVYYTVNEKIYFNNDVPAGQSLTRAELLKKAVQSISQGTYESTMSGISDILWYTSIPFGISKDQHDARIKTASISQETYQKLYNSSLSVLNILGKVQIEGRRGDRRPQSWEMSNGPIGNMFVKNATFIKQIAEIAGQFEVPRAIAFVNEKGKVHYPYNAPTPLSTTILDLNKELVDGEKGEYVSEILEKDVALNALGVDEYASIFTQLAKRETIRTKNFEFNHTILSAITIDEVVKDHKDLNDVDYLVLRLNKFLNQGKDVANYALPTPEDRSRTDFIELPKFANTEKLFNTYGIQANPLKQIEAIIVRDLIRNSRFNLTKDKAVFSLNGIKDVQVNELSTLVQSIESALNSYKETGSKEAFQDVFDAITEQARSYVTEVYPKNLEDFTNQLLKFNIISRDQNTGKLSRESSKLDNSFKTYSTTEEFIEHYVFSNLIAKIEFSENLRGGMHAFKGNVKKYYKRSGLLETPGNRFMIQGDYKKNPNYGMLKEYNEVTVGKFILTDAWHDKAAESIYKKLIAQKKSPEIAKKLSKSLSLKNNKRDISDGAAFISPILHKHLLEGIGEWTDENERMYKDYMDPDIKGPWIQPYIRNWKLYYETLRNVNGISIPEMDKNSHLVLTRELVKDTDVLKAMYQRMMLEGNFKNKGLQPIHMINTESAKKGYQGTIHKIDQTDPEKSFMEITEVRVQQGKNLYMPQSINKGTKSTTAVNRQIRKNTFAKLTNTKAFHDKIEQIIQLKTKELLNDLGFADFIKNPEDSDARLKFLQKIKAFVIDQSLRDGGLDSNVQEQLRIVADELTGEYNYALPLNFGPFQDKFQSLLFSLFKNNVYKLEAAGAELVQIPAVGKFKLPKVKADYESQITPQQNEALGFSQERLKAIQEVFNSNPELSKVGDVFSYAIYLDTIFPDSKVKDILYHGTPDGRFESFDVSKAGKTTYQPTKGIYFTDSKKTADFYAEGSVDFGQFESREEYEAVKTAKVFSVILNAKELKLVDDPQAQEKQENAILRTKNKIDDSGFIGEPDFAHQYLVFEPEQIHILGSKQDIEGFKEFVESSSNQNSVKSLSEVTASEPSKYVENEYEMRELRFLGVDENGDVSHAEIMVSQDFMEKYNLKIGDTGIAYRIPHQGYSSTIRITIAGVLPRGYGKSIMVPGNIVITTGADFDIDKMFSLFKTRKIKTAADTIMNSIVEELEKASASDEIFEDSITPLDQENIDEIAELNKNSGKDTEEYKLRERFSKFDHPLNDMKVQRNFKSAAKLVGIHANSISGLSIAVHAGNINTGLAIHPSKRFVVVDGETTHVLDSLKRTNPITKVSNFNITSQRLSAGLDAGSNPLHDLINENEITANAIMYLDHIGMDYLTINALMTSAPVKKFVDLKVNFEKSDYQAFKDIGITNEVLTSIIEYRDTAKATFPMNKGERSSNEYENAYNFAVALYAGKSLSKFYRSINADNVDGMGNLGEIQEYIDQVNSYKKGIQIVDSNVVDSILNGDAYKLEKVYYSALNASIDIANQLFIGTNVASTQFKNLIKKWTGNETFTANQHRLMDRALSYYMLTAKGSPLAKLLNAADIKDKFTNKENTFYSRLIKLRNLPETNGTLNNNLFLSKLIESPGYNEPKNKVYGLIIDKVDKLNEAEKNALKGAFENLIFNPQIYTANEEEQLQIKQFAEELVAFSLVNTGLAPGYGSYYDVIPVSYYLSLVNEEGISMAAFLNNEFKKVQTDSTYFDSFVGEFLLNYGSKVIDGQTFIQKLKSSSENEYKKLPVYLLKNKSGSKKNPTIDYYNLFNLGGTLIQQRGIHGKLIETNLRTSSGELFEGSIFDNRPGEVVTNETKSRPTNQKIVITSPVAETEQRLCNLGLI